ncbi:hypothetical protein SCG7109_AB_00420 [Chlamydiales bacterium SCGC AG-110-M15]|nr:hypothetical protein SCG7109_AB_00420 [Chlamydiales bacterium SCGC AG-110-M15]
MCNSKKKGVEKSKRNKKSGTGVPHSKKGATPLNPLL